MMRFATMAMLATLVVGSFAILSPGMQHEQNAAYAATSSIDQLQVALAANNAQQSSECAIESISQDKSSTLCLNQADQDASAGQTQDADNISIGEEEDGSGGDISSDQTQVGVAANDADQSNECGNHSILQDESSVECSNEAEQDASAEQSQDADNVSVGDGEDGGDISSDQIQAGIAANDIDQSNECGNYSILQDGAIECSNEAEQEASTEQTQEADNISVGEEDGSGGDISSDQTQVGVAANDADQSNECGNYSIVQDGGIIECSNEAEQDASAEQSQDADNVSVGDGEDGGDGDSDISSDQTQVGVAANDADQSNECGNYSIVQGDSVTSCESLADQAATTFQAQESTIVKN